MLGSSPNKCRFIAWKIIDIIEGGPGLGDVRDISPAVVARQWLSRATGNNFITATSLESWLINGIITRMADILRWVTYGEIHPEWCVFLLVQVNLTIHGGWHALLIALGRRFQILDEPLLLCSVYWVLWAPAWCHVPSFYDVYVNVIYIYIYACFCVTLSSLLVEPFLKVRWWLNAMQILSDFHCSQLLPFTCSKVHVDHIDFYDSVSTDSCNPNDSNIF